MIHEASSFGVPMGTSFSEPFRLAQMLLQFGCSKMDADHSSTITLDEFREALTSTKLPHFLESLGIATTDAWALFAFLDSDQSGDIEVEEFVSACLELNGPAKSYQIAQMSRENKLTRRAIKQMSTMITDMRAQLEQFMQPWSLRAE